MKRSARVLHMREIPGRPLIFSFSSYFFWVAPWDLKKPVLITLTSVFSLSRKEMSIALLFQLSVAGLPAHSPTQCQVKSDST